MGVFEFVVLLVLISTVGKVLSERQQRAQLPPGRPEDAAEMEQLRQSMDHLSGRLQLLEEERDFYRDLLEPPSKRGELGAPGRGEPRSDDRDPS